MPRYLFTITALIIAVLAFAYETSGRVSPETKLARHRETMSVTAGRSADGTLVLREIEHVPSVPVQARYANHSRTLRAFVAPNNSGVPALYLEVARPRHVYVLEGAFFVSADEASFTWIATTTLMFYGRRNDGALTRFTVDVHDLTLTSEVISTMLSHDDTVTTDASM